MKQYKYTKERAEYYNIINEYNVKDKDSDFNYIDILNISDNDLEWIKNIHPNILQLFKELVTYPFYKKILPDFLKKHPDWLEYFV